MSIIKKIWRSKTFFFYLPYTLWFNFKNFKWDIAVKLPVFLCKSKITGMGKYKIEGKIKTGMIRLGFPLVSVFNQKGIIIENNGLIIFKGNVTMGGGSGISIGENGILTFGDRFCNQVGGKIICYSKVSFGSKVRLGWNCLVCDTDFHTMKSKDGCSYTKGFGNIKIGDEVWIGSFCKLFKNTDIPSKCTIAANTLINKKINCDAYSLIYPGGGIKIKNIGYCRDIDDDIINYNQE